MKQITIKPIDHVKIDANKIYSVTYMNKTELCHILYAYPRKNMFFDENNNLTGDYEWVANKIGYILINPRYIDNHGHSVTIESVHICCGRFTIQEQQTK